MAEVPKTYADFLKLLDEHQKKNAQDLDVAIAAMAGLVGDFSKLKKTIADLQASQGSVTAEDQKLIDTAEGQAGAFDTKLTAFADALKALDEQEPPEAPPPPVEQPQP